MAKTDIAFDKYILKFTQNLNTVCEIPERLRTRMSVLLEKRFRGETLGDRIGRWNYKTNNYIEPTLDLQPFNIYTDNIVKPKVRANAAVMSQARIAILCDPRVQTTRSKKNAMICQKISDWVDDTLWTNDLLLLINEMKQLTHGVFLKSYWNEEKEGRAYDGEAWEDQDFSTPAQVACVKCGAPAYLEGLSRDVDDQAEQNEGDEAIPTPPCADCGGATEITAPSEKMAIPTATKTAEMHHGDNDLIALPSMGVRVDERYSQGGKLDKCKWTAFPDLMSQFEIEQEFGTKDLGDPADWPWPLKWLYTMQTGTSYPFKGYRQTQETIKQLSLYPVWRVYLTPEWLASYTAGVDYNAKGFKIKDGQSARDVVLEMAEADAKERNSPVKKKGLCVCLTGDKILGYYLMDFRKEYEYTYFVSDPYSFWALCYSELETMQHLVNQTLTAIGNQVQSNQNIGVFDRDAYDDDDLSGEKNQIYTREGVDKPIKDTFGVIPALPVTSDTWNLYQAMKQAGEEASMVSKEMQGQATKAQTFGEAQLKRDMSVGVLTPAQQSTADSKVGVFRQQGLIAQEHWPRQRLQELCDTAEGIITDEDIDTWYQSDLEADVIYQYREGSEMPKSFIERRDDIAYVSNYIATMADFVPGLVTPQLGMDLINRVADMSTIDDLDLQNSETDKEVAEIRYTIIVKGLETELQNQLAIAQSAEQLQAGTLFAVLQNPVLMPLKQENHVVAMEFYRDKSLLEYKKEQPNLLLVGAMQKMIERHRQGMVAEGQSLVKTQMEIQQPAVEQQQQMAQEAAAQEQEANAGQMQQQAEQQNQQLQLKAAQDEQKAALEQQKLETEQQRTDSDDEQAMIHKVLDMSEADKQREHELAVIKVQPKPKQDARA